MTGPTWSASSCAGSDPPRSWPGASAGTGPLWEGRTEDGADGRAYVCRNHACLAPVDDVDALAVALG